MLETVSAIPRPVEPGEETALLAKFHPNGTWRGVIHPGGMGPGTPQQVAIGSATHHWIQDGRWVVGDFQQDQYLDDGTFVLHWELHWVCGWDPLAAEYRATIADNYGRADVMRGHIDGDVMTFESFEDRSPKLRLTWDAFDPNGVVWRNEMSLDGEQWVLIEDYVIVPDSA
jgi:Protein of unknown function (DUF1579)